jgi:uncharacterized damage-inducible protein DinB
MTQADLLKMFAYHHWRVQKVSDHLVSLDARILDKEIHGSFASLADLLAHCIGSEGVWYSRFMGSSPAAFAQVDVSNRDIIGRQWLDVAKQWLKYVDDLTEADLQGTFSYSNTQGTRFDNVRAQVLCHVIDHATYHIGQITTALRELGQPPVAFISCGRSPNPIACNDPHRPPATGVRCRDGHYPQPARAHPRG